MNKAAKKSDQAANGTAHDGAVRTAYRTAFITAVGKAHDTALVGAIWTTFNAA